MKTTIQVEGLPEQVFDSSPIGAKEQYVSSVDYILSQINPLIGFVVERKGKELKGLDVADKFYTAFSSAKAKKKSTTLAISTLHDEIVSECKTTFHNCILIKHSSAPISIKIIGKDEEIPYEDVVSVFYNGNRYIIEH